MACTIDHLRVEHRVTVLRDFTDLAGVAVRAGEAGILRGLGADYARMEIWIELERNGARDQLRFALRAPDGPRIGRMKEFFEMGESIEPPPIPAPKTKPPPPPPPERTEFSLQSHVGEQAPDNTSLGELRVACDCDPAFHRELLPARGELSVHACLRCGTVTCSRSIGDDGRFTGNAWQENLIVALPDAAHRWISNWPRVKQDYSAHSRWPMSADFVRYPTLYYPADSRCTDLDDLAKLEARLAREQAGQSVAARQRATHRIHSPPPKDLPDDLRGYVLLWQALQLRPDSELSDLLHLAQPRSLGRDLAAELLRQRQDAFDLIVSSLRSGDATRRGVGFMIARDFRPADPRLAGVLIELIGGLSLEPVSDEPLRIVSRGQGELFLLLIAELQLATPEMLSTLRAWMRKIARHDDYLADRARIVVRELAAVDQAPPGKP